MIWKHHRSEFLPASIRLPSSSFLILNDINDFRAEILVTWPRNFKMLLAQIARAHSIRLIEEITQSKFQPSSSKTEFFTAVWSFDFCQTIFYFLHAFIRITATPIFWPKTQNPPRRLILVAKESWDPREYYENLSRPLNRLEKLQICHFPIFQFRQKFENPSFFKLLDDSTL